MYDFRWAFFVAFAVVVFVIAAQGLLRGPLRLPSAKPGMLPPQSPSLLAFLKAVDEAGGLLDAPGWDAEERAATHYGFVSPGSAWSVGVYLTEDGRRFLAGERPEAIAAPAAAATSRHDLAL